MGTDRKKWTVFGTARKMVKAGKTVEVWDYLDTGVKTGLTPPRRAKGHREREERSNWRSRRTIKWLVACNAELGSSYFFTATFADNVRDFSEATKVWEKFRRFLRKEFPEMSYVVVPELQKRGAWHFHAVFFGMPSPYVMKALFGTMMNSRGIIVDAWMFHFTELWTKANKSEVINRCSISAVKNVSALARYVTKYLTKETGNAIPSDRRCYFAGGKNLKRPTVIKYSCFMFGKYGFPAEELMEQLPQCAPVFAASRKTLYAGRISFYRWDLSPPYEAIAG